MNDLNRGAIFKNDNRTEENRQPDYRGHVTIAAGKFSIGAWQQSQQPEDEQYRGHIHRNTGKQQDTHPDYVGIVHLPSGKFFLSGWERQSKAGNQYISLAIREFAENDARKITGSDTIMALRLKEWQ